MKKYHIYVITQDNCAPCTRLKDHVQTLTEAEKAEIKFLPFKTPSGNRTAFAEEHQVELTPTLLVTHESTFCDFDVLSEEEFCDQDESVVEFQVGANYIIEHLDVTLDTYTYAHPE